MLCHFKPQQFTPTAPQNQERKQEIKSHGWYNAQINSGNRLSVISEKYLPALRRRGPTSHHIFRNRRLGDLETKHQKLAMDSRRTP
jgi:hypothetical protein